MTLQKNLLAAGLMLWLAAPVGAVDTPPSQDPRTAFAETDTDKNGVIDYGEFNARIVEVFYFADANKDGTLSPEEQGKLIFAEDFTEADKDKNGNLSLREFLRVRFAGFEKVDTNDDGVLTIDEVVSAWEGKKAQ
jgi:Ca2+-binding EF-hand superfamily protein